MKALSNIRFDATRYETELIVRIVKRYENLTGTSDRIDRLMDVEACHCNGCPLDLIALFEAASDFDLVHDVGGIAKHLNRETGRLDGMFLPRYAARERHALQA